MASTDNTSSSSSSSSSSGDPRDPSGFLKLDSSGRPAHLEGREAPTVVKIVGTARDDLNGLLGFCTAYNRDRERYMVQMASVDRANAPNATVMALKPQNLTTASTLETYQAQFQHLRTDPRVRQKLGEYYRFAESKCQPFKVEHVAGVVGLALCGLVYCLGFTKTLMLVSASIMIFCILVEDMVRNRKPLREVARNFPSRARMVMERQFPFLRGLLSDAVAAGVVGLLLALTVQSVFFTTSAKASAKAPGAAAPEMGRVPSRLSGGAMISMAQHKQKLEEFYHLGFADSASGKDQGHSLLPKLEEVVSTEAEASTSMDDLDNDIPYTPTPLTMPPPPPSSFASRLLSLRTAGSIFYLYRMATQIGTDPATGLFSTAQLVANLQHNLPVWQKGMIAFSLYNLMSNLFF